MMKTIYGPMEQRLLWNGLFGEDMKLETPLTREPVVMEDYELNAFLAESTRRSYISTDGERRTKIETLDKIDLDDEESSTRYVRYVTPEHPFTLIEVTNEEWLKYRAKVEN